MPDEHAESEVWLAQAAAGDQLARAKLLELHRARLRRMIAVRLDRRWEFAFASDWFPRLWWSMTTVTAL